MPTPSSSQYHQELKLTPEFHQLVKNYLKTHGTRLRPWRPDEDEFSANKFINDSGRHEAEQAFARFLLGENAT